MKRRVTFDRFTVFVSDTNHTFLVDNNVADEVAKRGWCKDSGGYMCANINNKVVRLHDFVMEHNGFDKPDGCYVDHVNFDKLDNRTTNLRYVLPTESSRNMPRRADNTSGVTGVCKAKNGRYRAYIRVNNKQVNLGYYATVREAAKARLQAEQEYGFKTRSIEIPFAGGEET